MSRMYRATGLSVGGKPGARKWSLVARRTWTRGAISSWRSFMKATSRGPKGEALWGRSRLMASVPLRGSARRVSGHFRAENCVRIVRSFLMGDSSRVMRLPVAGDESQGERGECFKSAGGLGLDIERSEAVGAIVGCFITTSSCPNMFLICHIVIDTPQAAATFSSRGRDTPDPLLL